MSDILLHCRRISAIFVLGIFDKIGQTKIMKQETTVKPKLKKIWVDPAFHRELKTEASREGYSIKDFIPFLLNKHKAQLQTTTPQS